MNQVFVSRQTELARLDELLASSSEGRGQICFVTGEAGAGKTSLTGEFARRAQQRDKELLVVVGDCNAQIGIGDPYLPFREVLGMLAGDIDDKVAQGMTTLENASRLKKFLQVSKRIILDVGPDLIDILVPGVGLVTRAGAMVAGQSESRKRRATSAAPTGMAPSAADVSRSTDQSRIFEQVTTVLITLSRQRPLILIFDDLQWIDQSSASLLFHLARRIEGSRILIIGTYREEDVALGRGDARHPLSAVVSELKRYYGDFIIKLGEAEDAEARRFIDALLDAEANQLGDDFRESLLQLTHGQPLFTWELLRDMQENGGLVKNAGDQWVAGPDLDWEALPVRVEGVIEERISRLHDDLHEILRIASVQGESFTAQVVARLLGRPERDVLKLLTQQLDQQHRLISEESSDRIGKHRVTTFRFRHHMFQKYLYEALSDSERELLHEDIAAALETLYETDVNRIAVRLARHYKLACIHDKAATYFLLAGQRALTQYAYSETIALAVRGIECLGRINDGHGNSDVLLELKLLLGEAQHHAGLFAESMETYLQTAELAIEVGSAEALARAALGYDEPRWRCNLLADTAVRLLHQALENLDDKDSVLRVRLMCRMVVASLDTTSKDVITTMLDNAVAMARRLNDPRAMVDSARSRLMLDRDPASIVARQELVSEMLEVTRKLESKHDHVEMHIYRLIDLVALGDASGWDRSLLTLQNLVTDIGETFYEFGAATMRTAKILQSGDFCAAEKMALDSFAIGQKLGVDNAEGVLGIQMFTLRREQGRLREIAPMLKQFVNDDASAAWRPGLALILAELGQLEEARTELDRLAGDEFAILPRDSLWQTSLVYLAEVCDYLQDTAQAAALYRLLLPYAEQTVVVGNVVVCLGATSRFLGQLAATLDDWDEAERHFVHALELNTRMDAAPWLAHTRYQYARMLKRRGMDEDSARADELLKQSLTVAQNLGMQGLLDRTGRG